MFPVVETYGNFSVRGSGYPLALVRNPPVMKVRPQKEREKTPTKSKKESANPDVIQQLKDGILAQQNVLKSKVVSASKELTQIANDLLSYLNQEHEATTRKSQSAEPTKAKKGKKK